MAGSINIIKKKYTNKRILTGLKNKNEDDDFERD